MHKKLLELAEPYLEKNELGVDHTIRVLDIAKRLNLDFDDAINYFICKSLKLGIVSFDKHFDKTDIKRVEPASIK